MRILYLHGSWFSWENGRLTISLRGKLQATVGQLLADKFDYLVVNTGMLWGKASGSYAQVFKRELMTRGVKPEKIITLDNSHPKALDTSVEVESLWKEIEKRKNWSDVCEVAFEEHLKAIRVIYDKMRLPKVDFRSTESIIKKLGTKADRTLLQKIKNSKEEKMLRRYEKLNILFIKLFGAKTLRMFAQDRNRPGSNVPWFVKPLFPYDIDVFKLPPKTT